MDLTGVPKTLLLPLLGRAQLSAVPNSPFKDPYAIKLIDSLDYDFKKLSNQVGHSAMNEDPPEQSALFHLMTAIRENLLDPGPLFERPAPAEIFRRSKPVKREWEEGYLTNYMFASARPSKSEIGVRGELLIKDFATEGACRANCTFASSTQWASNPVKVFCTEPWIRKEVNWHVVPEIVGCPAK